MKIDLENNSARYYLIVNRTELYNRAVELGFSDIILLDREWTSDDIATFKASGKSFAIVFFSEEGNEKLDKLICAMKEADINYKYWEGYTYWDWDSDSDDEVTTIEEAVKQFPTKQVVEDVLISRGYILDEDYTDRCGNCSARMDPLDKYCIRCGTKRGEGAFKPFKNAAYVLYGAPILKTECRCVNCGNQLDVRWNVFKHPCYCPACGSKNVKPNRLLELMLTEDSKEFNWFEISDRSID